ncbi:hypothetical protein [Haloplanus litoreus]|uniref:Uncharacterized protein n=1 Tax=Haloplanus litoreus TaxID=767515 RepID=A0ABD6A3B0_9EURY
MTRKSERELESAVTDLEPHSNDAPGFRYVVAFEGADGDLYETPRRETPADLEAPPTVVFGPPEP